MKTKVWTWMKRLAWCGLAAIAIFIFVGVWLTHNGPPLFQSPEDYFNKRVGTLAGSEVISVEQRPAYITETVRLRSSSGLVVDFRLRYPINAIGSEGDRRFPLMVVMGGHRTGKDAVHLLDEAGPYMVAALDYPLVGDRKMKGLRVLKHLPAIRRALYDVPPAVIMATNYLVTHRHVDPARMELVGVSLGAPLVCAAGAVEPRFARVWAIQGGGLVGEQIDHNLQRKISNPMARRPLVAFADLIIDTLEPELWVGRIAPRSFMLVGTAGDERIPQRCVEALYSAAQEPKQLIWTEGSHVRPDKTSLIRELFQVVTDRIDAAE